MGTLVSISTWNVPTNLEHALVQKAFSEMRRIEHLMSHRNKKSAIHKINKVPRGTSTPIDDELAHLIQQSLSIYQISEGAFNPSLLKLTTLWGFSSDPYPNKPPDQTALDTWLIHYPKQNPIKLENPTGSHFTIQLTHETVALDLGGIAKGHAIDQAMMVLSQGGIKNALVNAGGDMKMKGGKGEEGWRIGIQHPRDTDGVVAVSQLKGDIAMVTSGDYERFYDYQGQRYHHILDPRTAQPSKSGLSSVSVQTHNAALADALSTAILVLGKKGLSVLDSFPGSEALLIFEDGSHQQTPGFIGEWLSKP